MPGTVGERFKLIGLLETFLTSNPGYENSDPKVKVTAAEAKRLKDASVAANNAVPAIDSAAKAKKTARETAIDELRGTMRVLIGILEDKLAPDDARWADFGLNQPAADTTPAAPIGVTATVVDGAPVRWLRGTQACRFHATGSLALSASCGLTARQPHQSAKSAALQVTMQMPHQTPHSPQPSVNASV